ncbi:hypothetical protein G210_1693, partial [Candida maltosa Xu316]
SSSTTSTATKPRKSKELPNGKRGQLVGMNIGGMKPAQISKETGVHVKTVRNTLKMASVREDHKSLRRTGRPKKRDEKTINAILSILSEKPEITKQELLFEIFKVINLPEEEFDDDDQKK